MAALPVELQYNVRVTDERVNGIRQVREAPEQQAVLSAAQLGHDARDQSFAERLSIDRIEKKTKRNI